MSQLTILYSGKKMIPACVGDRVLSIKPVKKTPHFVDSKSPALLIPIYRKLKPHNNGPKTGSLWQH